VGLTFGAVLVQRAPPVRPCGSHRLPEDLRDAQVGPISPSGRPMANVPAWHPYARRSRTRDEVAKVSTTEAASGNCSGSRTVAVTTIPKRTTPAPTASSSAERSAAWTLRASRARPIRRPEAAKMASRRSPSTTLTAPAVS
jgi:hypothetical protein